MGRGSFRGLQVSVQIKEIFARYVCLCVTPTAPSTTNLVTLPARVKVTKTAAAYYNCVAWVISARFAVRLWCILNFFSSSSGKPPH